jgi:hypothetical protein
MATDSGPMVWDRTKNQFVWVHGYYNEGTNQVIDIDYPQNNSPDLNALIAFLDHPEWYGPGISPPGFDQTWGAVGYYIRPEYLDRQSVYRPQPLAGGNIPPGIQFSLT